MKLVIIDTDCANLYSVVCAFQRLGIKAQISADPAVMAQADKLILPGVGAAHAAMEHLQQRGLIEPIQNLQQPVLGICLGMQLMAAESTENLGAEETHVAMLKIVPEPIRQLQTRILPHMGWNQLQFPRANVLFDGVEQAAYVYFVHSYAMVAPNAYAIAYSTYEEVTFCAAFQHRNFYGMQFHPEKSGSVGEKILRNFVEKG